MDKSALVERELEIQGQVVEALRRAKIPVTAVDWTWVPQFESSQLVVVTSLRDERGPRESYARILEALSHAGVYQTVPIKELVVLGPEDSLAQELIRQLKVMREVVVHITRLNLRDRQSKFSVIFTPYLGSGGAIPSVRLNGDDELRSFLEKRLKIERHIVDEAVSELTHKGSTSIPRVQLTLRRAKKLNLAA